MTRSRNSKIPDRPSGIYDVIQHRYLLNYVKNYYRYYLDSFAFSDRTLIILNELPDLTFVPCFFLAYTLCRFTELSQIDPFFAISGNPIEINSSKSKHIRQVEGFLPFKSDLYRRVPRDVLLNVVSYERIVVAIKRITKKHDISLPKGKLCATHIFRHLEATNMYIKGYSIGEISYKLGHMSENTTHLYIDKTQ